VSIRKTEWGSTEDTSEREGLAKKEAKSMGKQPGVLKTSKEKEMNITGETKRGKKHGDRRTSRVVRGYISRGQKKKAVKGGESKIKERQKIILKKNGEWAKNLEKGKRWL